MNKRFYVIKLAQHFFFSSIRCCSTLFLHRNKVELLFRFRHCSVRCVFYSASSFFFPLHLFLSNFSVGWIIHFICLCAKIEGEKVREKWRWRKRQRSRLPQPYFVHWCSSHPVYLECLQYNFCFALLLDYFFLRFSIFCWPFSSQKVVRMQKKLYRGQMRFFFTYTTLSPSLQSSLLLLLFSVALAIQSSIFHFFPFQCSYGHRVFHCYHWFVHFSPPLSLKCLHAYLGFVCMLYFAINMYFKNFQADAQLYCMFNK